MTSTIKINDSTKKRFDKLQAKILLETGIKISQQELLTLLLNRADKTEDEIISFLTNTVFPLPLDQRKKILSLQTDLGFDTSTLDEDHTIYEE